ncbi:hypothetical protein [Bizionia arctica]|uniref:DUF3185 family protein n=1 Tax=Bizionia arctica TaxID=1495645 RepID=A0A917GGB7_9FLAO|nr:hypothetical protein [Bizionia arctica]GGG44618.1 hypothetical protein GCM10010976_15260 [Bizionia arctica]
MRQLVKKILLIVGVLLLGYGIYTLIAPEASVSIGDLRFVAQDNTDSYVTIGLGLAALGLGFVGDKK